MGNDKTAFVMLTPEQIVERWKGIASAIRLTHPPTSDIDETQVTKRLEDMTRGLEQCWQLTVYSEDRKTLRAVFIFTRIVRDAYSAQRNLLINGLANIEVGKIIPEHAWLEGVETLRRFAASEKCKKMIAFSRVKRVLQKVEEMGADTGERLIRWEVN